MTLRVASCSCGQLKAETNADPIRVSVCHCLACQRRTGSVFAAQARFPRNSVTISGASVKYVRVGDEGTKASFRFCPDCGATVYYTLAGYEDAIVIHISMLSASIDTCTRESRT